VQTPGDDEEDGRDGYVPAVHWGPAEDKGAMECAEDELRFPGERIRQWSFFRIWNWFSSIYLQKNELVKKHSTSEIRYRDADHDYDRTNHVALRPRLQDESIWIGWLGDLNHPPTQRMHRGNILWCHLIYNDHDDINDNSWWRQRRLELLATNGSRQ